jgi:hypothetical protein
MSEATSRTTTLRARMPVIDLHAHPDGLLLRLCDCLGRMRTAIDELEAAIARTPALTVDGRRMKELSL